MSVGTNTESEKRVDAILRNVRRELGMRDMFTFGASTIWSVLYVMGATGGSMLSDLAKHNSDSRPGGDSVTTGNGQQK